MTSQQKRPYWLGDWPTSQSQYPAKTDADTKALYFDPNPYGQLLTETLYNAYTSPLSVENIFAAAVPDVSFDNFNFNALLGSSAFNIEPVPAAYNTLLPFMPFPMDHNGNPLSPTHDLPNVAPSIGQVAYRSSYVHDGFPSNATQQLSNSATMTPSLQPHQTQRRKSRSITPIEARSAHGRSVGSEYVIDSSFGALTPGTSQSYEFVERSSSVDHNSSGLLAHENDLIGLEISPSIQTVSLDPRTTTEVYSGSPQGIHLDTVDPVTGMPSFSFDFQNNWPTSSNPDPWVPLSSHRTPNPNMGQLWNGEYNMFPQINDFRFPQQHETPSPSPTHPSPTMNYMARDFSNTGVLNHGEDGHDSVGHTHVVSREPTSSPRSSTRPPKVKRKAAGRRTGPLDESKKPGVKMTRKVHACWCCKMRKVTCNADTENACPECERFWLHKMTGPFENKQICIRTSLEDLQRLFIPDFMIEHLKSPTMDTFTKDLVGNHGWLNRDKTEVRLLCGFGPPLIVKGVQEFRPDGGQIQTFRWGRNNPNTPEAVPSLPIGIPQDSIAGEGDDLGGLADLEHHLDEVINNEYDLNEYAERILRSCNHSRSSRTLKVVLKWYQNWKDAPESMQTRAELLLRNAIKVIMINTIFARRLILQEIPEQFEKFFQAPYRASNYNRHKQSPRLINRQVKAALWVLQQRLLSEVLRDFGRELPQADGWPICFAVATILAFSLEQTQEKSIKFVRFNQACEGLDRKSVKCLGSERDIDEYRTIHLVRVFDMIHVLMRCKSEKQTMFDGRSIKRISSMGSNLRKVISDLKDEFKRAPEQYQQRLHVGEEEPCRLVTALLELIQ